MSDECWTPASFEIVMGTPEKHSSRDPIDHHETVEGETWGPFGINAEDDCPHPHGWFVTHLPTGYQLVEAVSQEAARQFCEEIAGLADWASVQRCPPEIRDDVLMAWHRARGAMFIGATAGGVS